MPFDGIVARCVADELTQKLVGGRVEKVFQPEADEIHLAIRAWNNNYRLVMSASASFPRIHVTGYGKENPSAPPVFCMLLRKHLSGGRLIGIEFNEYERILGLMVESANELGDVSVKKLVIEIMGRHSNIILVNHENKIIDSIKHVDSDISSVREVMPARPYVLPPAQDKAVPDTLDAAGFVAGLRSESQTGVEKLLLNGIKGFSPLLCREICHQAGIDGKVPPALLPEDLLESLQGVLSEVLSSIRSGSFTPCIAFEDPAREKPVDFHCLKITQYPYVREFSSISEVLDLFFSARDRSERVKQRKSDVLRVIQNNLERCSKKLAIQEETMREVADRDKLQLFGELITANIYCIPKGAKSVSLLNYYSENGDQIEVPLEEDLLPQENAQRYFRKYSKAKSTFLYTGRQLEETRKELDYLESVLHLLENCSTTQEIEEVRQELADQGYLVIKKKPGFKRQEKPTEPMRFKSSDGLEILVGKNNRQNDSLTLKQASSNDLWLHTRNIPGSHVIIRKYQQEIPDKTLLEAAILAAYHSRAKMSSQVPVDYTPVKNVKKPPGAKPGMVIYENFKTLSVTPDEETVKRLRI